MKNVLATGLVLFLSSLASAQDQAAAPAFEVASIKANNAGDGRMQIRRGGGGEVIMNNISLKLLIFNAYDVRDYSLSGPDWLNTVRFDINAKPPAGAGGDQIKPMLQALLAERFKLQVHKETKTISGYALMVAKGGPKIKEVQPTSGENGGQQIRMSRGLIDGQQMSMKQLADMLANPMGRPVVDMTELKGVFDFKLEFTPDGGGITRPEGAEQRPASDAAGPTIYTALQEQLGLRVQSQKVPIEVVIVDKVEKVPTEN